MALQITEDYLSNDLAWNGSSGNYSRGRVSDRILMLVMHATAGSTESTRSWFRSRKSGVSSHYVIAKDGTIYQELKESDTAYTAGRARWNGRTDINDIAVQIELENADTGIDPYPQVQYNAAVWLSQKIVREHHITAEMVVTHAQIAVPKGRKVDPAGFPMDRFKYDVFSSDTDWGRAGQPTDPNSPVGGGEVENAPKDDPSPGHTAEQRSAIERLLGSVSAIKMTVLLSTIRSLLGF